MIEQQERIEMIEASGSNAPAEMDARPFDDRLRLHDVRHGT
jgi:hypothetical protein